MSRRHKATGWKGRRESLIERMYTEQDMRRMVAEAMWYAQDDEPLAALGRYLADKTDANWQRLAEAVWPGGNDAVDDNPTPAR